MAEDLEIISFKILKVLYQKHREKPDSGLEKKKLIEQMDLTKNESGKLEQALDELIEMDLVNVNKKENYSITKKGKKHYKLVQLMKLDEIDGNHNVKKIEGDNNVINTPYSIYGNNYIYISSKADTINSSSEEAVELVSVYEDLLKMVSDMENFAMDSPKGKEMLGKLNEMERLIKSCIVDLNRKPEWLDRLESLFDQIKHKFKES
ncbi:MAG: hypothetical protein IEMM0008_0350 [bacterium]|nr:MAG: hypothetical protein IEMM0008_0350 [bacterium]